MTPIEVYKEYSEWDKYPTLEEQIIKSAELALKECNISGKGLSILLTGDPAIQKMNAQFRGKDKPTNVLSFPSPSIPEDPEPILGDIVISYDTSIIEAKIERKKFENHVIHLAIHGILHLIGYDHETEDEAEKMEELERNLLNKLAIPDPYSFVNDVGS